MCQNERTAEKLDQFWTLKLFYEQTIEREDTDQDVFVIVIGFISVCDAYLPDARPPVLHVSTVGGIFFYFVCGTGEGTLNKLVFSSNAKTGECCQC